MLVIDIKGFASFEVLNEVLLVVVGASLIVALSFVIGAVLLLLLHGEPSLRILARPRLFAQRGLRREGWHPLLGSGALA